MTNTKNTKNTKKKYKKVVGDFILSPNYPSESYVVNLSALSE